jgi:sugar/nucleoside kinase (ribokinase family)
MDKEDKDEGTIAAKCLKYAQSLGLKTSVDLISDPELGKNGKLKAALKYCDNLIVNEVEGGLLAGIAPRDENDGLLDENIEKYTYYNDILQKVELELSDI